MKGHVGAPLFIATAFCCLGCCDKPKKASNSPATQSILPGQPSASANNVPNSPSRPAKTVRIYVAGESIERRNRFIEPPFLGNGSLNPRSGAKARNDNDEYGWMIPFQDRLKLRNPNLQITWVGSENWLSADDNPYDGTYPAQGPGATSAISGTSIESWLEQREKELTSRKHCYDVAFASRGGNDFGNDDNENYAQLLTRLISALLKGSKCNSAPIVYVTAHMPDDQRETKTPDPKAYVRSQTQKFVERTRDVVAQVRASHPTSKIRFVDLYSPFIENRHTTAFPNEVWSRDGIPDFGKITRENDRMHPRRLASIYVGEIAADNMDLNEWYALP